MLKDSIITYLKEKYAYNSEWYLNITNIIEYKSHVHIIFSVHNNGIHAGWVYKQEIDVLIKDILACNRINKIKDILHE